MTLKQVVLPAPLGPMRPRISPVLMWNETPSSAVTPPNLRVTSSTSSILPLGRSATSSTEMSTDVSGVAAVSGASTVSSSTRVPLVSLALSCWSGVGAVSDTSGSFHVELVGFLLGGLLGPHRPPRRHQDLRPEDGQRHEGEAEEQEAGVGEEAELLGSPGEQGRSDHDTPAVALTADDDHRHEEHGVEDGEVVRVDELLLGGEERTREATDGRTGRERQQLEAERRHTHELGGVLVLTGGLPGPADARVLHAPVEEEHDEHQGQCQPVVGDRVGHAELQEPGLVGQVDLGDEAVPHEVGDPEQVEVRRGRDVRDASRAAGQAVGVDQDQADDLAEPERHDREVVAADAQGGGAQDDARHERDDHGDRDAQSSGSLAWLEPRMPTVKAPMAKKPM